MNSSESRRASGGEHAEQGSALPDPKLHEHHPADVAARLTELDPRAAHDLLSRLPAQDRAEVFGYLDPHNQSAIAALCSRAELADLLVHIAPDERVDLFNALPTDTGQALLPALAQAEREDLRRLASYAEGTVGAVMTSDYALLRPELTAREAVEFLRERAPDSETIYQAYVVDEDRRLLGTLSLRELIVAPAHATVAELMVKDVIFARVDDPREEAANKIGHYDLLALPVVNGGDRLVGIVTYDDAMDVAAAEATEDFHKAGGTLGHLDVSLKTADVGLLYRKRAFWLVVLVFGNIFSGAGIAYFEDTIAAFVPLVFFLPLLIGSSGNAGAQSATLMVRALATGDVVPRDWGRMLARELVVASLLGLTMAGAVSGIGVARGGLALAVIVASTMVIVVIVGSVIGLSLPFILSRLKLDPAAASAPLVTSIADATGVVIYFSIATGVLRAGG
jgi:magnesium transporter